ncbi:MAG: YhcH/YjgK/YiaL family protein, partial [Verrucomicrobiota bacterium]
RKDFARAFSFLRQAGVADLPPGRHEVDSDRVYAVVGKDTGRGRQGARLEAHRKYIDIQFVVAGHEVIGWEDLRNCRSRRRGYDREKDIEFFTGEPARWVTVPPGSLAIFFPEDAHAPLAGEGPVHKVVVKVAADQPEKAC